MNQILDWDKQLLLFLNNLGSPLFDSYWMIITNRLFNIFIYISLFIYFTYLKSWKHSVYLFFFTCLLVLFTDQITNLFKIEIGRVRPCHDIEIQQFVRLVKPTCGGGYSFFSGHASNSFALALFFSSVFKYNKFLFKSLILIASIVAYSRIYIGVHYPSDILFGSIFGILSGLVFSLLWSKIQSILLN